MGLKEEVLKLNLDTPPGFFETEAETLKRLSGGCGPGRFGNYSLADTIWGISVKPACGVHDFEYSTGLTFFDKCVADERFYKNMLKIINKKSRFWLFKILRRHRAKVYYKLVLEFGHGSFQNAGLKKGKDK